MRLPDQLQHRSFTEWNHVVRGIMEMWELANLLGMESYLEDQLAHDEECRFADFLGKAGNDCLTLAAALRLHAYVTAIQAPIRHCPGEGGRTGVNPTNPDLDRMLSVVYCALPATRVHGHPPPGVAT